MVSIGSLQYDIVADTTRFKRGIVATRKELNQAKRIMKDTETPADRLADKVAQLTHLHAKGALTTRQFNLALKHTKREAAIAAGGIKGLIAQVHKLPGALKSAAFGFVAFRAAGVAIGAVATELSRVDEAAKTARKLGESADELVGLQLAAAEFSGFTEGQLNQALQRMTRRVAEAANGTGEARAAIEELGLDARRLNEAGPAQAFRMIADAIKGVNSDQDKLRIAFKLFDSEGAGLVNTLNAGSAALLEMKARADELGLTFTDIDAQQIEAANDAIHEATAAFKGAGTALAIVLAPSIRIAADLFEGFGKQLRQLKEDVESFFVTAVTRFRQFTGQASALPRVIGNRPGIDMAGTESPQIVQSTENEISRLEEVRELRKAHFMEMHQAQEDRLQSLRKETELIEKQNAEYGKTREEIAMMNFHGTKRQKEQLANDMRRFAHAKQMREQQEEHQKKLDKLEAERRKREEQQIAMAKKIRDENKKAQDEKNAEELGIPEGQRGAFLELVEKLREIKELEEAGKLKESEAEQARANAEKDFKDATKKPFEVRMPPSVQRGSREEYRVLARLRNAQSQRQAHEHLARLEELRGIRTAVEEANRNQTESV